MSLRLCISFLFVFILFISCATSPKTEPVAADGTPDFSILPSGATLYLWADVARAKPLLEAISPANVSGKNASQVLDRTDTAMAAFYSEDSSRRFFMAGWGNYPSFRAGVSMGFSRDWKKIKSATGNRYWHSQRNNLGIAFGSKVAYVSDGDPFTPGMGSNPSPQGFEEFRRSCVLSGWLNNPASTIDRFISNLGIPIQIPAEELFFGAVRAPVDTASGDPGKELWDLVLKIRTPSAGQARSLISLISFARIFVLRGAAADMGEGSLSMMDAAALLLAKMPEQEEEFLVVRMNALSESRIALLFAMFPVYSK